MVALEILLGQIRDVMRVAMGRLIVNQNDRLNDRDGWFKVPNT